MALFQKKPDMSSSSAPIYTLGLQKTVLIVGLGNIGKKYDGTRHNIGFACIDTLAVTQGLDSWTEKKDLKCHMASGTLGDTRVLLCKPTTLMNNSGLAVQAIANFYKVHGSSIAVVYDELDIDFGQIRLRIDGSAAGHNGVKSVIQHLGEDFGRIRIGIGPKVPYQDNFHHSDQPLLSKNGSGSLHVLAGTSPEPKPFLTQQSSGQNHKNYPRKAPKLPEQIDSADYVLAKFDKTQQLQLPNLLKETTSILTEFIHSGQLPTDTRSFIV